jgi:transposase-like protein
MPSEDDRPGPAVNLVQLGMAKRIVRPVLERIMSRGGKATVLRYHTTAPNFANWLEANVPEALTAFAFPAAHRRRLRTSSGLERLNKEIKCRTRVATLFPNDASVPRLVAAVLSKISDDWESERSYLNMTAR